MLAGGGAGAYFYFQQEAEASAPADEAHASKKKENKKKDKDGHGASYEYVKLDPLILPIVDKNGVSQVVSMVLALEADPSATDKIRKLEPKLKDAYIQDLYGVLNEHAALKGGVIQVGYIKSRLVKISNEVMHDGEINDVLLQVVQQRPI